MAICAAAEGRAKVADLLQLFYFVSIKMDNSRKRRPIVAFSISQKIKPELRLLFAIRRYHARSFKKDSKTACLASDVCLRAFYGGVRGEAGF